MMTTAGTRKLAYDAWNRMVRFEDESGRVTRYECDPFGRRTRKIIDEGGAGERTP
ncbi:MAG: RHS repeat protein [Candidatus Sumerlaeia bacterium]|nr:RHS repeat protein [Candidatus Sumerlaeia bacterium]